MPHAPARRSATPRHPALTITLHWLSALAVSVAFGVAWSRASLDDPGPRAALMVAHQCAGLVVLALLFARIGARIGARIVTLRDLRASPRPRLMHHLAIAMHLALYALLLAQPLLGWALTNAHGHDVRLPGLPVLPHWVPTDPDLADTLDSWHARIAEVLAGAIAMHVLAALFHHFVCRDDAVRAMLPLARARRQRLPAAAPAVPRTHAARGS